MIERVLEHLARHGIDEVVLSLGYRPDAFLDAYPDGTCAGVALAYAVEDEPLDTAGAIRFAAREAGYRRHLRGGQRRRADRSRRDRPGRPSTANGRPRPPSRSPRSRTRPRSAWCRPTTDGRVLAFIEKPPPGRGADQPDQRRHLRARAVGPRPHPGGPAGVHRAGDLPRPGRPTAASTPWRPTADWIDAGTPATYLAANLRYAAEPRAGPAASARGAPRSRTACSATGVTVGAGAVVEGSVLLRRRGRRRRGRGAVSIVGSGAPGSGTEPRLTDLSRGRRRQLVVAAGARLAGRTSAGPTHEGARDRRGRFHRLHPGRPAAGRGPRRSTWSTTCPPGRWPTWPRPGAARSDT